MRLSFLFSVTALFWLAGCGGGGGFVPPPTGGGQLGTVDNQPPTVNGRLISGTQSGQFLELPFSGGTVQLEAIVTDPSGVALVEFSVNPTLPNLPQPLTRDNQGRVTTSITLPANLATTNQSYQFQLRVRDNRGNEATVIVGTVEVRSPFVGIPPLPQPPF
ncbi:MAG: hypothetical protein KEFWMYNX_000564 [Candidatus Fervidibacter sp.]|jgi:hypothetical protein